MWRRAARAAPRRQLLGSGGARRPPPPAPAARSLRRAAAIAAAVRAARRSPPHRWPLDAPRLGAWCQQQLHRYRYRWIIDDCCGGLTTHNTREGTRCARARVARRRQRAAAAGGAPRPLPPRRPCPRPPRFYYICLQRGCPLASAAAQIQPPPRRRCQGAPPPGSTARRRGSAGRTPRAAPRAPARGPLYAPGSHLAAAPARALRMCVRAHALRAARTPRAPPRSPFPPLRPLPRTCVHCLPPRKHHPKLFDMSGRGGTPPLLRAVCRPERAAGCTPRATHPTPHNTPHPVDNIARARALSARGGLPGPSATLGCDSRCTCPPHALCQRQQNC